MVIKSGSYLSNGIHGAVEANIEVYPRSFNIAELQEREAARTRGYVFIYNLENMYSPEGKLMPTTASTLGCEVPARSRELWRMPELNKSELVYHLLNRSPLLHPCRRGEFSHPERLADVLDKTKFLDFFAPKVINGSWYQFSRLRGAQFEIAPILEELVVLNSQIFGAYKAGKPGKTYLRSALKEGLFEIGYVDVEQSA